MAYALTFDAFIAAGANTTFALLDLGFSCITSSEIEAAYAVGGLPPVRNSATMVSKCQKTICKSLTIWPLWWLAWIAGKAGEWMPLAHFCNNTHTFVQQGGEDHTLWHKPADQECEKQSA